MHFPSFQRASSRTWKSLYTVLQGHYLYCYKDKIDVSCLILWFTFLLHFQIDSSAWHTILTNFKTCSSWHRALYYCAVASSSQSSLKVCFIQHALHVSSLCLPLLFAIFVTNENGDKQRPTNRQHVQGILAETDPLTERHHRKYYVPASKCIGDKCL